MRALGVLLRGRHRIASCRRGLEEFAVSSDGWPLVVRPHTSQQSLTTEVPKPLKIICRTWPIADERHRLTSSPICSLRWLLFRPIRLLACNDDCVGPHAIFVHTGTGADEMVCCLAAGRPITVADSERANGDHRCRQVSERNELKADLGCIARGSAWGCMGGCGGGKHGREWMPVSRRGG